MAIKVLVVDDEKDIAELVRHHLEREGFQCLQAGDGPTALRLTRQHHPDLLILDLLLPGLDGLEVCRQAHGGELWIESRLNRGTTVHFTLPAAQER